MKRHDLTAAAILLALPLSTFAPSAQAEVAAQSAPAQSAPAPAGSVITVTDAYARSNNPDVGAVFLTLSNAGTADCVLTGVTAPGFGAPELHTHRDEAGVMKMVKVDSLTVPAGGTHELARGGDHIMLMKPEAPIAQGQKLTLTLDLGSCGAVPVEVAVDNAAGPATGRGMADGAMPHAGHPAPEGTHDGAAHVHTHASGAAPAN